MSEQQLTEPIQAHIPNFCTCSWMQYLLEFDMIDIQQSVYPEDDSQISYTNNTCNYHAIDTTIYRGGAQFGRLSSCSLSRRHYIIVFVASLYIEIIN